MKAKKAIFRSVQQESFKEVKLTHLQKKNPFLDVDGLLRARGRLVKSKELTFAQKHPIILDGKHHVTGILLRNEHLENHHVGNEQLRTMVRVHYWIFDVSNKLRSIKTNCVLVEKLLRKVNTPLWRIYPKLEWTSEDHLRTPEWTTLDP